MGIKVNANEELFKKFRSLLVPLAPQIGTMAAIVQNDIEVTPLDLREWSQSVDSFIAKLEEVKQSTLALKAETMKHIQECSKK